MKVNFDLYALAYPPNGIANKFEPSGWVEFGSRLVHSFVACLNDVEQGKKVVAIALVLFGYRHHKAQIGINQLPNSSFIA